jgi:hypothetical protein
LQKAYENLDLIANQTFPNEEILNIHIPENQLRVISLEFDIINYLEKPQETDLPIIKLLLPEESGSILVLASMIPRRLMEATLLKLRNYLQSHNNRDFFEHKLSPQLPGKDAYLKDAFNQISTRPLDFLSTLEEGGELSFLFWAHFCMLVKGDIKKKKERLTEDTAAIQSVYISEYLNGYYKTKAVKAKDRELAFKALEQYLEKPPYNYTLDAIIKFTNPKGGMLLDQYSETDLENWLRAKTAETPNKELPEVLLMRGARDERWYVRKDKIFPLLNRFFAEARLTVRDAVSQRWNKLLLEFSKEPAMENEPEFERLLTRLTGRLCPGLSALLADPKLALLYSEVEREQGTTASGPPAFFNGRLLPYAEMLFLKRRELLHAAKLRLPFWYSLPIITPIIAFFQNWGRKKPVVREEPQEEIPLKVEQFPRPERKYLQECENALIPSGHTVDGYLPELEGRWSRLIDNKARANLVEDVKSLVRDYFRKTTRLQKNLKPTVDTLREMADTLVSRNPALQKLSSQESLRLYIQVYLIKLLHNINR